MSISLGIAGYQPRMPEEVLRTASGDCKDKATTFVTAARALGFEAYPLLASANGKIDVSLPSLHAFDHEIAAVKVNDKWMYLDLTDDLGPFGEQPPVLAGDHALLVHDDGTSEMLAFAPTAPADNIINQSVIGALDNTGRFVGNVEIAMAGPAQYDIRGQFPDSLTEQQRSKVAAAVAGTIMEGAKGDSFYVTRGRDLQEKAVMRVHIETAQALRTTSEGGMLKLPIERYATAPTVASLEQEKDRKFFFTADRVVGVKNETSEFRVTLPDGWKASLPPAVHATSAFGVYDATYEQVGNVLKVTRHMEGKTGVLPPSAKGELVAWLNAVNKDDAEFVFLKHN